MTEDCHFAKLAMLIWRISHASNGLVQQPWRTGMVPEVSPSKIKMLCIDERGEYFECVWMT
jgi:hypothetical protein